MEGYKKSRLILFIVFLSLCLLSLYIYNSIYSNDVKSEENSSKYVLLSDYSRFFTVNSCIYKYVVYVENKDVKSLLSVLDEDYKNDKGINESNIFDFVDQLNGNYSFKSKKIYYEKIGDNKFKYYVNGFLYKESIDGLENEEERNYIVNMDNENQLFSIAPYDGKIFKEGVK